MTKLESVIRYIKMNNDSDLETIAKFKENLDINPMYAFEWSRDAFRAAARIKVAAITLPLLENAEISDEDRKMAIAEVRVAKEAIRMARNGENCSSQVDNIAKRSELQAWAEMSEKLNGRF